MRHLLLVLSSAVVFLLADNAYGQAVISAHSGVVHFSEGSVFLDDQPLDHKVAAFPSIKEGSTLRTEKGRAEVLLTPGVFLRMDENSSIRMRSTSLNDTRVDLLQGSVIVDSLDALGDNHVAVIYKDSQVRFPKQGVYRLDFETATVQAYSGEAEITHDGKTSTLDDAHLFFLTLDLTTKKLDTATEDEFYDWARERSDAISAENQAAAQGSGDVDADADASADPNALGGPLPNYGVPSPGNGGLGGYPMPDYSAGMGSVLFNPFSPYYSAGLPYYSAFQLFPVFVIFRPYRYGTGTSAWPPSRGGTSVTTWNGVPRWPITRPAYPAYRPAPSTVARPAYSHPAVIARPAPAPAAIHVVGHR